MRKFVAGSAVLALAISTSTHAAVFYEPFDYPTGDLGLNVNPSVTQTWYSTLASGTDDRVQVGTGSLSGTGLPDSVGNMATFGGAGRTDRIFLGQNRTTGEVYYSLLMNVTDLTGAATGGATIFGFNNTPQTALNHDTAGQPTAISGRLLIKPVDITAGTYQIGAGKAGGNAANFAFTDVASPYSTNSTVYIVGRYTFTAGADNDVFDMWINPSPATFADDALIPTPDLTTSSLATPGADSGQIATIILRQFTGVVPAGLQFDEIRVDTTWAHATSNLVPEPASLGVLGLAVGGLMRRRRRHV
jgi:hypothetical protein